MEKPWLDTLSPEIRKFSSVVGWERKFSAGSSFFGMLHKLPFLFTFITAHKYFMNYGPLNCVALTHRLILICLSEIASQVL